MTEIRHAAVREAHPVMKRKVATVIRALRVRAEFCARAAAKAKGDGTRIRWQGRRDGYASTATFLEEMVG